MLVAKNLHFIAFVRVQSNGMHKCIQGGSPKVSFELVGTGTASVKQNISGQTINLCLCVRWVDEGWGRKSELGNSFVTEYKLALSTLQLQWKSWSLPIRGDWKWTFRYNRGWHFDNCLNMQQHTFPYMFCNNFSWNKWSWIKWSISLFCIGFVCSETAEICHQFTD